MNACCGHDVGRQLLTILQQQEEIGMHGEPPYRRAVGPGHGTKPESLWWTSSLKEEKRDNTSSGKQRENLGLAIQ